jgi:hypothetical protein
MSPAFHLSSSETLSQSGLMTAGEVQAFLDGLRADKKPETGEEQGDSRHPETTLIPARTRAIRKSRVF